MSGIGTVIGVAIGGIIIFAWDNRGAVGLAIMIGVAVRQMVVWAFGRLVPWSDDNHVV